MSKNHHPRPKNAQCPDWHEALSGGSLANMLPKSSSSGPKVNPQKSLALNSDRLSERMVEARLIAKLPKDSPRRKPSLPKIGGGT